MSNNKKSADKQNPNTQEALSEIWSNVKAFGSMQAANIRSLPLVLGLVLCAINGFVGVGVFSWILNFTIELASSNLIILICIGVLIFLSVKTKMVFTLVSLPGIIGIAFAGFFMSLLMSVILGWISAAISDIRIPLMIVSSVFTAYKVYEADLQRIVSSTQSRSNGKKG